METFSLESTFVLTDITFYSRQPFFTPEQHFCSCARTILGHEEIWTVSVKKKNSPLI